MGLIPNPYLRLCEATASEPIIGWRLWRIVQVEEALSCSYSGQLVTIALISEIVQKVLQRRAAGEAELDYALGAWGMSQYYWPARKLMQAECAHKNHQAPKNGCRCGCWAFKDLDYLDDERQRHLCWPSKQPFLAGSVALAGKVIECEHGYRAQYAYPQELELYNSNPNVAEAIAARYGIPVVCAKKGT